MSIRKTIQERLRIPALFVAALSVVALAGCGSEAPLGAKITVTPNGSPIITNPSITASMTKTQQYRVDVADAAGLPMNDIYVDFMGQFTNGQSINFNGDIGSVPISAVPGVRPSVTLSSNQRTGPSGYAFIAVTAPYYATGVPLSFPLNQTALASATGGALPDGTYFYQITSLDIAGESTPGGPISATVTNVTPTTVAGSIALSWAAVPGATSYNVYGRSTFVPWSGAIGYLVTIICPCPDPVTYTDLGNFFPQAGPPPGANTTGLSVNSIIGTARATAGSSLTTFSINF